MKYNFEIINDSAERTIQSKNVSPEFIAELTSNEGITKLQETKFYMYGVYDKITILANQFMILKNSKKFVVLLKIGDNNSATYN